MLRVALASLRRYKARYATTVLAVVLGVVFVTGTMVFSDTLESSFESSVMGSAQNLDAVVHSESDAFAREPVDDAVLEDIRERAEVEAASGMLVGRAAVLDDEGRAAGFTPPAAVSLGEVARLEAAEGRLPEADDEAALTGPLAEMLELEIGDTLSAVDPEAETHELSVVGLVDVGTEMELSMSGAVVYTEDTARMLSGVTEGFHELGVRGAQGYSEAEVAAAVEEAAGTVVLVRTGEEFGAALAEAAGTDAELLRVGLLLFAVVSMFVAGIVIYNTFAILIAQRQRDLALLRCVGAVRGQVFRAVLAEAAAVGLVASALGAALGVLAGHLAMRWAGPLFGVDAAEAALVVSPFALAAGIGLGLVVTVASSTVPAVRANRVAPLAALRSGATAGGIGRGGRWPRWVLGTALFAAAGGIVAVALGVDPGETPLVMVVGAGLVAFLGVAVMGPLIVRGVVTVLGLVLRLGGVAGTLAADNARRSPKRAATAMIALVVGATLITGYSVISASLERTATVQLDEQFPVDYVIQQQMPAPGEDAEGTDEVPTEVREGLKDEPTVRGVFAQRLAFPSERAPVSAFVDADLGEDLTADMVEGELSDLVPGTVVLSEREAGGLGVGDDYVLDTDDGEESFEVAAVVHDMQIVGEVVITPEDFARLYPEVTTDATVYVRGAQDAEAGELREAVYEAAEADPRLQVSSAAEVRNEFEQVLQVALFTVAGMLGLAILIALIGIANTLTLSVLERVRESALLRALGLSRGALRRMLGIEALTLSVIGTVVGVALGVVFGWAAATAALEDLEFAIPVGQVAVFLAAGVLAGLLAAILPGRRAAQASITAALGAQ